MWPGAAAHHDRGTSRLITPATLTPIALDIARQHLRQDAEADDVLIEQYLRAAVQSVEDSTGRAMCPQVWEYRLREMSTVYGAPYLVTGCRLRLPIAPVLAIESITADGVDLDPSEYELDAPSGPTCGRGDVLFLAGSWGPAFNGVSIRYRAGYETPAHVPAALVAAVLLALGSLYDNREAEAEKSGATARMLAENPAYMRLLRPYQLIG